MTCDTDTHLVQRFQGKPLSRKFELLDYVKDCQKEINVSRTNNRVQYNYNKIAEDFVKKYNVARREKETAIELLELHDPPEKRALPVGNRQKNTRTNLSPRDTKSPNRFELAKSGSMKIFRIKSKSDVKLELTDPVVRARKRVPGAELFWKNYQTNPKKFSDLFEHVNGIKTVVSNTKSESGVSEKAQEGVTLSKMLRDEQELLCEFGPKRLIFRNMQPIEGVITHGFHNLTGCIDTLSVVVSGDHSMSRFRTQNSLQPCYSSF